MKGSNITSDEQLRLATSIDKLNEKTATSKHTFDVFLAQVKEQSMYLSENYNAMDAAEKAILKANIAQSEALMHTELSKQLFYEKAKNNPFFGRVDWQEDGEQPEPIYVGVAGIENAPGKMPLVCDWRAPISSLFYDYGVGKAKFEAPQGELSGNITNKRQYKIEKGCFVFGIDVNEHIADEVLKESLASATSGNMKTIVSTIQKEQNQIIRKSPSRSMLLQGIAGSGKTSIALHRIAYLLYRQKDVLKADDVLIVSPSLVFSKYIGSVLPELGEENMDQTTFEGMAKEALQKHATFESKEDMIANLLQGNPASKAQIDTKSSFEFLNNMLSALQKMFASNFKPKDFVFEQLTIKADTLKNLWETNYTAQNAATKLNWITDYITNELSIHTTYASRMQTRIRKMMQSHLTPSQPLAVLKAVYENLGLTLTEKSKGKVLYEDLAPLLLVHHFLHGLPKQNNIKCLVVDEMQDHTPISFYLLQQQFRCPMIVLGDIYQSVEHSYKPEYLTELANMLDADLITLNTSYRSTQEISNFAQSVIGLKGATNFARHGLPVSAVNATDMQKAVLAVQTIARTLLAQGGQTALVLTNPNWQPDAEQALKAIVKTTNLYENEPNKLIITNITECKGMEFDHVVVLCQKPKSMEERKALYVASSRALHNLFVVSVSN